jgi:hypothetical protein
MLKNLPRVLMGSSPKQMTESVVSSRTSKYLISLVYLDSPSVLQVLEQCAAFVVFTEAPEESALGLFLPLSPCAMEYLGRSLE